VWVQKDWIGKGGEMAVREVSLGKKNKEGALNGVAKIVWVYAL